MQWQSAPVIRSCAQGSVRLLMTAAGRHAAMLRLHWARGRGKHEAASRRCGVRCIQHASGALLLLRRQLLVVHAWAQLRVRSVGRAASARRLMRRARHGRLCAVDGRRIDKHAGSLRTCTVRAGVQTARRNLRVNRWQQTACARSRGRAFRVLLGVLARTMIAGRRVGLQVWLLLLLLRLLLMVQHG